MMKNTSVSDVMAFGAVTVIAYWMMSEIAGKKEGFEHDEDFYGKVKGDEQLNDTGKNKPSASRDYEQPNQKPKNKESGEIAAYEEAALTPIDYKNEIAKNSGSGCDGLKFVSTNLLPKGDVDLDDSFAEFSPANLEGQNFLDSRNFTIGMQSQVLRNANLQLRSEPQNPQEAPCAWNQSTIKPEARREMVIGGQMKK